MLSILSLLLSLMQNPCSSFFGWKNRPITQAYKDLREASIPNEVKFIDEYRYAQNYCNKYNYFEIETNKLYTIFDKIYKELYTESSFDNIETDKNRDEKIKVKSSLIYE